VLVSLGPQGDDSPGPRSRRAAPARPRSPAHLAWTEVWKLDASPVWHVDFSGIPDIAGVAPTAEDTAIPERGCRVAPLAASGWSFAISRPAGCPRLADDRRQPPHRRPRGATNRLDARRRLRSSRGGEQTITLPPGGSSNGDPRRRRQPLRQEGDKVTLSFRSRCPEGRDHLEGARGVSLLFRAPRLDLGARSVNALTSSICRRTAGCSCRRPRWAGGPLLGPVPHPAGGRGGLARPVSTPLRFRDWVLLGWACRRSARRRRRRRRLAPRPRLAPQPESGGPGRPSSTSQLLLVGWTRRPRLPLWAIHARAPRQPEMQIAGNASTASSCRWFADRAGGFLPRPGFSRCRFSSTVSPCSPGALARPALLRWLRWGWES